MSARQGILTQGAIVKTRIAHENAIPSRRCGGKKGMKAAYSKSSSVNRLAQSTTAGQTRVLLVRRNNGKVQFMEKFSRMIVEWEIDHWTASFENIPEHKSIGQSAMDSIGKLMASLELADLSMVQSVSVKDETTDDFLEISTAHVEASY